MKENPQNNHNKHLPHANPPASHPEDQPQPIINPKNPQLLNQPNQPHKDLLNDPKNNKKSQDNKRRSYPMVGTT